MKIRGVLVLATLVLVAGAAGGGSARSSSRLDPGVGNVPQGTQADATYAASVTATNVFATTQKTSCYRPEVQAPFNDGPDNGYTGETPCPGANTGEDTGAPAQYPTQVGSNPGFAIPPPMLVKDHSESDIRVDPTNSNHLTCSASTSRSTAARRGASRGTSPASKAGRTTPTRSVRSTGSATTTS